MINHERGEAERVYVMELHPDKALERFDELTKSVFPTISQADTRAKLIDPILKDVLGWSENDITKEEHVKSGFIDYKLALDGFNKLVIEATLRVR